MPLPRPIRPTGRGVRRALVAAGALLAGTLGGWVAGLLRAPAAPSEPADPAGRAPSGAAR